MDIFLGQESRFFFLLIIAIFFSCYFFSSAAARSPVPVNLKWTVVTPPSAGRREKSFVRYLTRCVFIMAYQDGNKRFHTFFEAVTALYSPAQPME